MRGEVKGNFVTWPALRRVILQVNRVAEAWPAPSLRARSRRLALSCLRRMGKLMGLAVIATVAMAQSSEWRGSRVAPEDRCTPYDRSEYRYPQSIELEIIERDGLTSPYTGEAFASRDDSDIEHVVATNEAHDSGLCAASDSTKRAFSRDLLNLVLANPRLNRFEKSGKDAAGWMPDSNRCWFAETVIAVKSKYGLTIDPEERDSLAVALSTCAATALSSEGWGNIKALFAE